MVRVKKSEEVPEGFKVVRKRREPTADNIELGKLMKQGKSMKEAWAIIKGKKASKVMTKKPKKVAK